MWQESLHLRKHFKTSKLCFPTQFTGCFFSTGLTSVCHTLYSLIFNSSQCFHPTACLQNFLNNFLFILYLFFLGNRWQPQLTEFQPIAIICNYWFQYSNCNCYNFTTDCHVNPLKMQHITQETNHAHPEAYQCISCHITRSGINYLEMVHDVFIKMIFITYFHLPKLDEDLCKAREWTRGIWEDTPDINLFK